MRKLTMEFIGTFFLVLLIGLIVTSATPDPAQIIGIGIGLMVLVYMGGHVSGAHYNPAVTIGLAAAKKFEFKNVPGYVVAQILGALFGAFMTKTIVGKTFAPMPGAGVQLIPALLVEILLTFLLMMVVLNVATHKKMAGTPVYGLAIGGTIVAAAYAGGGISGGAFNPAVGFGPTVIHALTGGGTWEWLWVYLVGPTMGAIAAAQIFSWIEADPED